MKSRSYVGVLVVSLIVLVSTLITTFLVGNDPPARTSDPTGFDPKTFNEPKDVEGGYRPVLPVTAPAEKFLVINLDQDLPDEVGVHSEAADVYVALTAIQGIVNRTGRVKVFFTGAPSTWDWKNLKNREQRMIDAGVYRGLVVLETPPLDAAKKYPALSYLTAKYKHLIRGSIRFRSTEVFAKNWEAAAQWEGQLAAAVTAAGIEDAVPVTAAVEAYLRKDAHEFRTIADVTTLTTRAAAFDWAYERYFTPETNRRFVGFSQIGIQSTAADFDYFIACRAFVISLDPGVAAEKERFRELLSPRNYPMQGTPTLGEVWNEKEYISVVEELGHVGTIMSVPNLSATSGLNHDPALIPAGPPPKALPLDKDGMYLAYTHSDGDAMYTTTNWMWPGQTDFGGADPADWPKVKTGMDINPFWRDLNPAYFRWWASKVGDNFSLQFSMSDGGAVGMPATFVGQECYEAIYRYYFDTTNGSVHGLRHFYGKGPESVYARIDPYFVLNDWWGWPDFGGQDFKRVKGTNVVYDYLKGPKPHSQPAVPAELADSVRLIASKCPPGTPCFAVVKTGSQEQYGKMDEAVTLLGESPPAGRKMYFLTPRDLAATWKAWKRIPTDWPREEPVYPVTPRANLAWGRPTTASSNYPGLNAPHATDGEIRTRWAAERVPAWIEIDLGGKIALDEVVLRWEIAHATNYRIETSDDRTNWTTIYSTEKGNGGTERLDVLGQCRYFRLNVEAGGASLWDIELYGGLVDSAVPPGRNK